MNGIHDLGGMHGFGPVETNEPVPPTLEWWEAAVIALSQVGRGQIGGSRLWNIDESRYAIERMGNAEYLNTSYFEHWLARNEMLLIEKGVVTPDDIATRAAYFADHPDAPAAAPVGTIAERVPD